MTEPIIGVAASGSRSGKDTICDFLVRTRNYVKIRFSDAIVDECEHFYAALLQAYIDETKSPFTARELLTDQRTPVTLALLQDQGTMRRAQDPEYWTKKVRSRVESILEAGQNVAVSGVRYPNEAELIKSWGGLVFKVQRPGSDRPQEWVTGVNRAHPVEHGLDGYEKFDFTFLNDGTVQDLEERVVRYLRRFEY